MKLKVEIPLLFLIVFVILLFTIGLYFKEIVAVAVPRNVSLLDPRYIGWLLPLLAIICLLFLLLIVYFHFYITRPLQRLNDRLSRIGVGHVAVPLVYWHNDEIGDLYRHFNEMDERLRLARKEQTDMIAAIAHDLRMPLTSINGCVELLTAQRPLSEAEQQEYYALMRKKIRQIEDLIKYFSTFTRQELELESIVPRAVNAQQFFINIADEYETELAGFDYELQWQQSFAADRCLLIDEPMIRRVFGNLFSNAVRYGDRPDLRLWLRGYAERDTAYFQLEDNGSGVPEQDLPSLFLKFFTVDKARQSRSGDMGLGLASCRSIVEHHGGKICAFRSEHGGLGIRFSLPLAAL